MLGKIISYNILYIYISCCSYNRAFSRNDSDLYLTSFIRYRSSEKKALLRRDPGEEIVLQGTEENKSWKGDTIPTFK